MGPEFIIRINSDPSNAFSPSYKIDDAPDLLVIASQGRRFKLLS